SAPFGQGAATAGSAHRPSSGTIGKKARPVLPRTICRSLLTPCQAAPPSNTGPLSAAEGVLEELLAVVPAEHVVVVTESAAGEAEERSEAAGRQRVVADPRRPGPTGARWPLGGEHEAAEHVGCCGKHEVGGVIARLLRQRGRKVTQHLHEGRAARRAE